MREPKLQRELARLSVLPDNALVANDVGAAFTSVDPRTFRYITRDHRVYLTRYRYGIPAGVVRKLATEGIPTPANPYRPKGRAARGRR
jgi:hypothetical protein